ncbi:MAG TPA: cytochrome c oxidase subunit 4 [Gemmatimonadales bacterium]|nr:cytochrome c oxidase subunit 4 [Candidatus Limnocylindria bacterium]HEU4762722.1 cytochrome c oxidase subunit 4 [Gemmatimonadales bacterium]
MAEELRFFLRTGAYSIVVGGVYWFVSYEVAGSLLLLFVVFSSLVFVGVAAAFVRQARNEIVPDDTAGLGRVLGAVNRVFGFEEHRSAAGTDPLAAGLEPIPTGSLWPLVAGIAALLLLLGLVYGPWLLLPGIVLAAGTVWGWVTQSG